MSTDNNAPEGVNPITGLPEWMNNPKYDDIYDQLKEEGYSTGSADDCYKLYAELQRRIKALKQAEDQPTKE